MTKSAIRELLTDKEINDCLNRAFLSLSPREQENLQPVIDELIEIPRMGPASALRLIFAVDQVLVAGEEKKNLPRLNEILKGG